MPGRDQPQGRGAVSAQVEAEAGDLAEALRFAVDDELSLFQFWPKLFAFCRCVNGLLSTGALTGPDAVRCAAALGDADAVLGLLDAAALPLARSDWPQEASRLVLSREADRQARDFARADALRVEIEALGYRVEDAADGARLFPRR